MNSTLFLIEHNTNLDLLKNRDSSKDKIISLDFIAHKKLLELGIKHELFENYFQYDDKEAIDALIVEKYTNWYKSGEVSKYLTFENVNLGWLLEIEISTYLAQVIRKFVGLIRLFETNYYSNVYCSNLLSLMLKNICDHVNISELETNSETSLHFENVEIPLHIGNKTMPIRLSRNTALKIKKLVEFSTAKLLNIKVDFNQNKTKPRLLLLDFNIILYKNLISELSNHFEVVLLNERRPAIWNLESLKLFRKLNVKIVQLKDLADSTTNSEINTLYEDIEKKLNELFYSTDYLRKYFSIEQKSFWPAIEKNFIIVCKTRFREAVRRYFLAQKLFELLEIDRILAIYSTGVEEKMILRASQKYSIPGLILQHGRLPKMTYLKKYFSIIPIEAGPKFKNALWGTYTAELFSKLDIPNDDPVIVGSPKHDQYFQLAKSPRDSIVFFDSFATEITFNAFDTNRLIKNENVIQKICEKLNGLDSHKFLVKLHPGQHTLPYSLRSLISKIDPKIPLYQSEDIFRFLPTCDIAVLSELSTVVLEAMILEIPTIVYLVDDYFDNEEIFTSKSSLLVHSYEEFEIQFDKLITDSQFRNDLISRGNEFIKKYFSNQGNSSENFHKFLLDN